MKSNLQQIGAKTAQESVESRAKRRGISVARVLYEDKRNHSPERRAFQNAWRKNKRLTHRREFSDIARAGRLKSDFGITPQIYDELLASQGGACAICGGVNSFGSRLAVDHNHETGIVRGLLCQKCNSALGLAGENPIRLMDMAGYLLERN